MGNSQMKYTDREYLSIFQDLYSKIPDLTSAWTSKEETDPGIVLIKLMAMLGDMLSYNQDRQALEVFPDTVTQRKNANQIFSLLGYRMHWYKSATCNARFSPIPHEGSATIEPYQSYSSLSGITYSNLDPIVIDTADTPAILTQGIPVTPPLIENKEVEVIGTEWHAKYDFNIKESDIVNCRYYLPKGTPIAEDSVFLVDNNRTVWRYPNFTGSSRARLNLESDSARFFEVCVDEYDTPYIQFPESWNENIGPFRKASSFKLFYLNSSGSAGVISKDALIDPQSRLISNEQSTSGFDPESPEEARQNVYKYQNTLDTLITLDDFRNAVLRIPTVYNCLATDAMTDPVMNLSDNHMVNLYVIPDNSVSLISSDERTNFKNLIRNSIDDFISIPKHVNIYLPDESNNYIDFYDWSPECEIHLTEPVDKNTADKIISNIDTRLKYAYSISKLLFNTPIDYFDLLTNIKDTDGRIRHVNMSPIIYSGGRTDKDILGKVSADATIVDGSTSVASFNLGFSLKPGSILISVVSNNMTYTIKDIGYPDINGDGSLVIVAHTNQDKKLIKSRSKVNYITGEISLAFSDYIYRATLTAERNRVGICRYTGDYSSITIAPSSLKVN